MALFTNKKSKTDPGVCRNMLHAAIPMLEAIPVWNQEMIHDSLVGLAEGLQVKNATLMWPIRIAAAGKAVTPGGAVEICQILGREETIRRLKPPLKRSLMGRRNSVQSTPGNRDARPSDESRWTGVDI